jgi:hypothetical protein
MKLLEFNWNPTDRQLRQFAAIAGIALPLVGWLWGAPQVALGGLAVAGVLLACCGFVLPKMVRPAFIALMVIATPIGMVVGELAMIMIYFGLFLPIGLCFRVMRRDALALNLDRDATTYWSPKKQPTSVSSYYRQF